MIARSHPFIEVTVGGRPVNDLFYSALVSATIHDEPGQDADTVDLVFDDALNQVALPSPGQIIVVRFGFRGAGSFKMGRFAVEKPTIEGGPDGEFVRLSGQSAELRSSIKETGSEHFDDTTVGEVVRQVAGRLGLGASVSPSIATLRIDYLARFQQSPADFLTRLADRTGAVFSIKDGKVLFLERGTLLAAQTITRTMCESWTFEVEPRPMFGTIEACWFDRAAGKVAFETHSTGLQGPLKRLRKVGGSAAEARAAARAEGDRLARATGSGSLTLAGMPEIMADTPIVTVGFRAEANGLWRAASVDHVYDDTYKTTVRLEAPETGKT